MSTSKKTSFLQDMDQLFRSGIAASGDGALVRSYLAQGDETAFAALVARHGPMVRGVCRRLLGNPHDADDAFQATFLVLVRKARQLRDPDRLGPWLYGVASRVARKARLREARHRHEPPVDVGTFEEPGAEWVDVMPILDAELSRLSANHRDVLVLCLLNGASPHEAAAALGCPVGTVKSRLARAREALQGRLVNKGIAPAVALAVVSSSKALTSSVSSSLAHATLELIVGSSVPPGISALTRGALLNMFPKSIMISSVLLGSVAVTGLATAIWLGPSRAQEPPNASQARNQAAESSGPRHVRITNMKQILLAFHNYLSTNAVLPAAASYGADGLPKLSWRVALLPYLGESELFKEFHQDEPWDSEHNHALLKKMPAVYQTPDSPAPESHTRIQGFAGKGAMFEGVRGMPLTEVTDGTSNTVLITMARFAVPWTKPEDLPFAEAKPLPALDDSDPYGYALGMTDGSVRSLPKAHANMLRSIVTRAGGEVIIWPPSADDPPTRPSASTSPSPTPSPTPSYLPTAPQPTPAPAPAPVAISTVNSPSNLAREHPAALEERLQRVEEKLDRLLKKLEEVYPEGRSPR